MPVDGEGINPKGRRDMSVLDLKTWTNGAEARTRRGIPYPPGPWDDEPDKAQWIDSDTGLDCLIVRNHFGALCGYVGLPPGHPNHGSDYDDVEVDVHGGLTYANRCMEDAAEGEGICHAPAPGRPEDVWWLGFDCAHLHDMTPYDLGQAISEGFRYPWTDPRQRGEVYRDFAYATAEVTSLAAQLAGRS